MNQLISNVLGLKIKHNCVILDPVLSPDLDGLQFDFAVHSKQITIKYHITGKDGGVKTVKINNREVKFERLANPYRTGGVIFPESEITANDIINVYL